MLPVLFIYHKDCYDGFGAAWVHRRANMDLQNVKYFPAAYQTEPPWDLVKGSLVILADFSYKRPVLEEIKKLSERLVIYDHHKTAQEDLEGFPDAHFDMNRSGAGMLADLFNDRNWLVDAIEDRDLWRFKHYGTKAIVASLSVIPFEFDAWNRFFVDGYDDALARGGGILLYIRNFGKKAWEHRRLETIAGFVFPVINIPYMNCSDHLDQLMELEKWDRAASFFQRGDGYWQFSLRSRGEFDVSAIAKKFGGGGHKNAAGFEVVQLPWKQ